MIVSSEVKRARLAICKACPAHTMHLGQVWCGTPLIGGEYKGHKLCGCDMNIKTELKQSSCPAGKWNSAKLSDSDLVKARQIIELYERTGRGNISDLYNIHYKLTGISQARKACSACLQRIVHELKGLTGWTNSEF